MVRAKACVILADFVTNYLIHILYGALCMVLLGAIPVQVIMIRFEYNLASSFSMCERSVSGRYVLS